MDIREVRKELSLNNITFPIAQIGASIEYAFDSVKVLPSEVGMDVYTELIHEKVIEYLVKT